MGERLERIKTNWNNYHMNTPDVDWLIKQAERVEELEEERDEWKDTAQSYYMTNQELRERNKRYKQALEFYADKKNYCEMIDPSGVLTVIEEDNGEKARQALERDEN